MAVSVAVRNCGSPPARSVVTRIVFVASSSLSSLHPRWVTMLSIRSAFRQATVRALGSRAVGSRFFSSDPPKKKMSVITVEEELEEGRRELELSKSPTQRRLDAMTRSNPYMVFGSTEDEPDPELPDDPKELAMIDVADHYDRVRPDGTLRHVHIRQLPPKASQSPLTIEKHWIISFSDNGEISETWENPLMGWTSGADPMAPFHDMLMFQNALEAVYFCKKRGWNYTVAQPIHRPPRDDDAEYQDNFLPKSVTALMERDGLQCNHWERPKAGASHYTRPLKYHGDGEVTQYGSNPTAPVAKHVEGSYKRR